MRYMIFGKVVGELLFVFGLLGWIYGVGFVFLRPSMLSYPLSHLTPWWRLDDFTIFSFFISMAGFFMWRLAGELTK